MDSTEEKLAHLKDTMQKIKAHAIAAETLIDLWDQDIVAPPQPEKPSIYSKMRMWNGTWDSPSIVPRKWWSDLEHGIINCHNEGLIQGTANVINLKVIHAYDQPWVNFSNEVMAGDYRGIFDYLERMVERDETFWDGYVLDVEGYFWFMPGFYKEFMLKLQFSGKPVAAGVKSGFTLTGRPMGGFDDADASMRHIVEYCDHVYQWFYGKAEVTIYGVNALRKYKPDFSQGVIHDMFRRQGAYQGGVEGPRLLKWAKEEGIPFLSFNTYHGLHPHWLKANGRTIDEYKAMIARIPE